VKQAQYEQELRSIGTAGWRCAIKTNEFPTQLSISRTGARKLTLLERSSVVAVVFR